MAFPSPEQREAIERLEGSLLVLAPAGSGKTQVMASRLARAIERGIDPRACLGLTFTNRAAGEMRRRVVATVGEAGRGVRLGTFHALCAGVLREEADALGLPRDFVVYDDHDGPELLAELAAEGARPLGREEAREHFQALAACKSSLPAERLDLGWRGLPAEATRLGPEVVDRYHAALRERHALDFADLVYGTRALFALVPDAARRWARRFRWIQVDEVQDTHGSEYEVVAHLARASGNLALFGDFDQTIYEWRGSAPDRVLDAFERDFRPVHRVALTRNHRATRRLLEVADRVAASFARRRTALVPSPEVEEGDALLVRGFRDAEAEAAWIAAEVRRLQRTAEGGRIGVLGRVHRRVAAISTAMTEAGCPHVTVEQFEFFRRQEVKDAVARLRLVLNPNDAGALRRALLRPPSGVGKAALREVHEAGGPAGLRLVDLVRPDLPPGGGDPFGPLLAALAEGRVAVLDLETTGLAPEVDEPVEVACLRVGPEADGEAFHRLVRPGRPVGDSARIHGHTDEALAREGRPPAEVLRDLEAFLRGAHVVGHNVGFDLAALAAAAAREGVALALPAHDDTLDLARRFLEGPRYDLASLAGALGLARRPTHRAMDDVRATADLLRALAPRLEEGREARGRVAARHAAAFAPIAAHLARWRVAALRLRPGALLDLVLAESGLRAYAERAGEPRRLANLDALVRTFERDDDPRLPPRASLEALTRFASLARNVDHLADDDPRVPVITVHQAKGLEFDTVFLAGLAEGEFPSILALREGRIEEERRLFYVAVTRARRRLVVTSHARNEFGYAKRPSPFLDLVRSPRPVG